MGQRENYYSNDLLLPRRDEYFVDKASRAHCAAQRHPKKQTSIGRARLSLIRSLPTRAKIFVTINKEIQPTLLPRGATAAESPTNFNGEERKTSPPGFEPGPFPSQTEHGQNPIL